jgi:hypothetical protein
MISTPLWSSPEHRRPRELSGSAGDRQRANRPMLLSVVSLDNLSPMGSVDISRAFMPPSARQVSSPSPVTFQISDFRLKIEAAS